MLEIFLSKKPRAYTRVTIKRHMSEKKEEKQKMDLWKKEEKADEVEEERKY